MIKLFYFISFLAYPVFIQAQNVGIGTTSPVTKLNIVGTASNPAVPGTTSTALFRIGTAANEGVDFGKMGTSPYASWMQSGFNASTNDPLSLQPLGGNVGIGTTAPAYQLQLNSPIATTSYMVITNTTTGSSGTDGLLLGISGINASLKNFENGNLILGTNNLDILGISPLNNGTVIIGNGSGATVSATGYKLNVHGRIVCTEVMVKDIASWPDYVFGPGYPLLPLMDVKKYIALNKHLPNLPNAATVEKNGLLLADMQKRLIEKVEELTLYILQQEEKMTSLQDEINSVKKQLLKVH
jgi:hypothetical protein